MSVYISYWYVLGARTFQRHIHMHTLALQKYNLASIYLLVFHFLLCQAAGTLSCRPVLRTPVCFLLLLRPILIISTTLASICASSLLFLRLLFFFFFFFFFFTFDILIRCMYICIHVCVFVLFWIIVMLLQACCLEQEPRFCRILLYISINQWSNSGLPRVGLLLQCWRVSRSHFRCVRHKLTSFLFLFSLFTLFLFHLALYDRIPLSSPSCLWLPPSCLWLPPSFSFMPFSLSFNCPMVVCILKNSFYPLCKSIYCFFDPKDWLSGHRARQIAPQKFLFTRSVHICLQQTSGRADIWWLSAFSSVCQLFFFFLRFTTVIRCYSATDCVLCGAMVCQNYLLTFFCQYYCFFLDLSWPVLRSEMFV